VALERFRISEDGFEGLLLLVASVFRSYDDRMDEPRCAPPEKEIEQKVEAYAVRTGAPQAGGFFYSCF